MRDLCQSERAGNEWSNHIYGLQTKRYTLKLMFLKMAFMTDLVIVQRKLQVKAELGGHRFYNKSSKLQVPHPRQWNGLATMPTDISQPQRSTTSKRRHINEEEDIEL